MRNSRIAISSSNSKDCKQLQGLAILKKIQQKISSKHVHVFHLHYSDQADNFGDQIVTLLGHRCTRVLFFDALANH